MFSRARCGRAQPDQHHAVQSVLAFKPDALKTPSTLCVVSLLSGVRFVPCVQTSSGATPGSALTHFLPWFPHRTDSRCPVSGRLRWTTPQL